MSRLALWSILILGIGIRMLFLSQPIALDEARTYLSYASQPLAIALSDAYTPNNHLFHTLLVHLITRFGTEEWIIRLPAFLAGITVIPATYALGKRLYNTETGLLAAALVTASSALIEYSTNARGYTLVTLFTLLLALTASYLVDRETWRLWGLFILFSALGAYTLPIMLYPFASVFVWLGMKFMVRDEKRRLLSLTLAGLATGALTLLLYLPVLLRSGIDSVIANSFVQPLAWQNFVQDLPASLERTWHLWNRDMPLVLPLLLLVGVIIALVIHRHISRFPVVLFGVTVFVSGLLVLIGRTAPFPRVWLWLMPLYFITASASIAWLVARHRLVSAFIPVTAVLLCAGICVNIAVVRSEQLFGDVAVEPDAENVALYLTNYIQPDADYAVVPVSSPLVYYFMQHDMALEYLGGNLAQVDAERLLVVVPEPDYTLESLLNLMQQNGLNIEGYSQSRQIAEFETASVWELTR